MLRICQQELASCLCHEKKGKQVDRAGITACHFFGGCSKKLGVSSFATQRTEWFLRCCFHYAWNRIGMLFLCDSLIVSMLLLAANLLCFNWCCFVFVSMVVLGCGKHWGLPGGCDHAGRNSATTDPRSQVPLFCVFVCPFLQSALH